MAYLIYIKVLNPAEFAKMSVKSNKRVQMQNLVVIGQHILKKNITLKKWICQVARRISAAKCNCKPSNSQLIIQWKSYRGIKYIKVKVYLKSFFSKSEIFKKFKIWIIKVNTSIFNIHNIRHYSSFFPLLKDAKSIDLNGTKWTSVFKSFK